MPLGGGGGGGGRGWQLWSVPGPASPSSAASPFLKYFCSQEGTMLFTVSVTRLMRPDCYRETQETNLVKTVKLMVFLNVLKFDDDIKAKLHRKFYVFSQVLRCGST